MNLSFTRDASADNNRNIKYRKKYRKINIYGTLYHLFVPYKYVL